MQSYRKDMADSVILNTVSHMLFTMYLREERRIRMYADENVIRIKHDVLYEVAKHAFAGDLEETRDHIDRKSVV